MKLTTKEKKKDKLLKYLGNPENGFPNGEVLAKEVLGYRQRQSLYKMFTADELHEIWTEALRIRRKRYAAHLAEVDQALLTLAKTGDAQAAKLVYQRFEGWSEKHKVEHSGEIKAIKKTEIELTIEIEQLEEMLKKMDDKGRNTRKAIRSQATISNNKS